jgi:hypothetical protein
MRHLKDTKVYGLRAAYSKDHADLIGCLTLFVETTV